MQNKNNVHPQHERVIQRYRRLYALLLRLYSKPHRERFGLSMKQTFNDLLQERAQTNRGLFTFTLWLFFETTLCIFKENLRYMVMQKKGMIFVIAGTGLILLIPLIGNQLSTEVNWSPMDFLFAAIMLMGTGFSYLFLANRFQGLSYRMGAGVAVLTGLSLIWSNLAVGLLGSEDNPANLMYFGVFAVGVIGAFIAHFRPRGMTLVMITMALAQGLVALIALMIGIQHLPDQSMTMVVMVNGFFMVLFLLSAMLFKHAAM